MSRTDIMDKTADETFESGADEKTDIKETLKKSIKVRIDDAGVLRKTLTITVPRDDLQVELDKEYKELLTEATVPGFRKGRAPRRLIEKRFGRDVSDQVQTRIVSNAYLAAIDREDIKVLGDPLVWVGVKDKAGESKEQLVDMQRALALLKIPDEGEFEFKCEVEIKPEFDLPELEGIAVEKPVLTVSDEDVTTQIDRIRARRGSYAPAPEGDAVAADDFLICDVKMFIDGAEVKTLENARFAARAQMIEGAVISEFGDKLTGAKVGDSRTVEGELPDDHEVADWRGKKAKFELKLHEIKRLSLPELDKAFLESMGFDKIEEFRTWVRTSMESQLEQEVSRGMQEQVRRYLLESSKFDVPEGLSSKQAERIAMRRRVELQRQGVPDEEIEKHADELMTGAREQAATELKLFFILDKVAEKWEIDVNEEEMNAQIQSIAQSYNKRFDRVRDELAQNNGLTMLYLEIRDEKCIQKMLEKAKITETKPGEKKAESKKEKPAKEEEKPAKKTSKKADAEVAEGAEEKAPKAKKKAADSAEGEEKAKPAKKAPRKKSE